MVPLHSPGSVAAPDLKPAVVIVERALTGKEFPEKNFNLLACSVELMLIFFSINQFFFSLTCEKKKKVCVWLKGY